MEAQATAQAINMPHQLYIVQQMNACRRYNGSRHKVPSQQTAVVME